MKGHSVLCNILWLLQKLAINRFGKKAALFVSLANFIVCGQETSNEKQENDLKV